MTERRPWWASDGPVDGGLDRTEDPVERFRAARRGGVVDASGVPAAGAGADPRTASGGVDGVDEPRSVDDGEPSHQPFVDEGASDDVPFVDEGVSDEVPFDDRGPGGAAPDEDGTGGPNADGVGPWWEAAAETVSRLAQDLASTAAAHDPRERAAHGTPRDTGTAPSWGEDGGPDHDDGAVPGQRSEAEGDGLDDGGGRHGDGEGATGARDAATHRIDACGICPVCVGLRALGEARPELVGHLAEAARHVALAARSLAARPPTPGSSDEPMQHIDLDA